MGSLKCGAIPLNRGKSSTEKRGKSSIGRCNVNLINPTSRNPLESGQKFNSRLKIRRNLCRNVAIPLNRGKSSTEVHSRNGLSRSCRNPLESGQKFNESGQPVLTGIVSRNPLESGQKFNRSAQSLLNVNPESQSP